MSNGRDYDGGNNQEKDFLNNQADKLKAYGSSFISSKLTKIVLGTVAGLGLFYATCTTYIKPNEQGVKQVTFSPLGLLGKQGIHEKTYEGGKLAIVLPSFETMHKFPADEQFINMHVNPTTDANPVKGDKKPLADYDSKYSRVIKAAHIQTSDGFYVDLDVSIAYRITNPYKTITRVGGGQLYMDNGIIPRTEPALKDALGRLNPEEFYNPAKRVSHQNMAKDFLNKVLVEEGITVDEVMIRRTIYHPDIQERLEKRKLQDQLIETNKASKLKNDESAKLSAIANTGTNNVKIRLLEGDAYATRKSGDQDLYSRSKKAEADKLVQLAEAEKTRMINDSYTGEGSDLLVALQMAEVLKGIDKIFVTTGGPNGLNPLDLESTLKKFDVKITKQGGFK